LGKQLKDKVDNMLRKSFDHFTKFDRRNPDGGRRIGHEAPSLGVDSIGSTASRTGFAKGIFDALGGAGPTSSLYPV
jgi:hypothetical protein